MTSERRICRMIVCLLTLLLTASSVSLADIVVPTLVDQANTNSYSTATPDKLTDNSGMTPAVNTGDSLQDALAAVHVFGGVFESWVTNGSAPDYFASNPAPVFIWDVTGGGDTKLDAIILWQYQNDGGGTGRVGNHAKTIQLQFNTDAQGQATFTGPTTTIDMVPVLNGINAAQEFDLDVSQCRYVRMAVTDNQYGAPNIIAGGDRVGLGEVRFDKVPATAGHPVPGNNATDICPSTVLSWDSGLNATSHDVYFGTDYVAVSGATVGNPLGVLVATNQTQNRYPLTGSLDLDLATDYFFRVDERVGAGQPVQGDVWMFTTEPIGYAVPNAQITAVADSNAAGQGPEKTIDLSGDLQSTDETTMWLSEGVDPGQAWIEYEFDKSYELSEMRVWNYNGIGLNTAFGIRDALIEYSLDGVSYTTLGDTHEFTRAPGAASYASNTTIDLSGVTAKYVRITAQSNWGGGLVDQYGLSEVRFFYVPLRARSPEPADGATGVAFDTDLVFRPGRGAVSHELYLSTNRQAVADESVTPIAVPAGDVCGASYTPGLELNKTYYWKVNEVGDSATSEGDIWSFTTQPYRVVDDMSKYGDVAELGVEGARIWYTWQDGEGWTTPLPGSNGNGTGSVVDVNAISYQTQQSLAFFYDNDGTNLLGTTGKALYSEITANVGSLQAGSDWTAGGVQSMSIYFYGNPNNDITQQLYVKLNGAKMTYDGDPADINDPAWHEWNINLSSFGIDLTNVTQIAIGFGNENNATPGGSGVVLFDDIRLHPARCVLSYRTPGFAKLDYAGDDCVIDIKEVEAMVADWLEQDRISPPLITWQKFDEGAGTFANDSSGNGNTGTVLGDAQWSQGQIAGALSFDGANDEVEIPYNPALNPSDAFTVSAWINPSSSGSAHRAVISGRDDFPARGYILYVQPDNTPSLWVGYGTTNAWYSATGEALTADEWVHVAGTYDNGELALYVNGVLEGQGTAATFGINTEQELLIGAGSNEGPDHDYYFEGQIDDARVYDKALSQAEVASIMDGTLGAVSDYHPLKSPAELDANESQGSRVVNFKDLAVLLSNWGQMELYP